jgi:16S rRNA (cytosine1402-N4)-methyltransferase
MGYTRHVPVLLREVLEYLDCRPNRIYVDGTVGSGGHAGAILARSSPTGQLIGLDWDREAIRRARETLKPFGGRVELREGNYKDLDSELANLSIAAVDGILLDLGLSTEQVEDESRGFSFLRNGPLDMRMNREGRITAGNLLERLSVGEMSRILKVFGEERWAGRIAKGVVRRRQAAPIRTTGELVEVIRKSIPVRQGRIHPATRTFQALRIAVNEELQNLQTFLERCADLLNPGGRLVIISFHSLEDRAVKNHFRLWAKGTERMPPSFSILTRKPVIPSSSEILDNPKARSAKLRAVEKILVTAKGRKDGGSDL